LQYVKAFGGTKQSNLPSGYTQVDYIYFLASSYLTTGINPSYDGRYEFDFQTTTLGSSGATTYLGVRPSSSGNGGLRVARISSQVFRIYGFGAYQDSTITAAPNTRYKFVWDNQHAVITSGGSTVLDLTYTGTDACAYPITINGWNSAGTITPGSEGIFVYSFKAWNAQGELVADYVPTKDPDGVVGFYDTVSESFKTATAGTIAAGPDATPTPTPDAPVDIVSNNGVLKFTANEANYIADNVVLGYWLRNSDGQPEGSPANFYTAMMPVKPNVSYVCFGRNKGTNTISGYNRIAWYDADGVWIRNSTYTQNQPGIDTSPANAVFARFHCNINGTPVTQELVDSYNWVFQQGTAEVPYTPYSPTGVYADGAVETIKDSLNNTATAEMLLKVGNYQDQQEILSGAITRNVGVKVLDGTENWTNIDQYSRTSIQITDMVAPNSPRVIPAYCNYFENLHNSEPISSVTAGQFYLAPTRGVYFHISQTTTSGFKTWLAAQYAAGTPVIIVYPLATPTTESVTGQHLQVAQGDNTLEITQASLAGLELEAEYTKVA
jgi:hypothetical protein